MNGAEMAGSVAVVENVWGEAFDKLARTHDVRWEPDAWVDDDLLRHTLSGAQAVVVRNKARMTAEMLAAAPDLRIVARAGTGLDNIDLDAADNAGVVVSAALGVNAMSVAEHTLALALAVLREIPAHDRGVRNGEWNRSSGRELSGKTWGLLGFGATGMAVARVLRGFDVRVLAYDPYVDPAAADVREAGVTVTGWDEVLGSADVLSVHLPATRETRHVLSDEAFAAIRPGAVLVSAGRGEVIDESALAAALRSGTVAGAGLDVRESEPPGRSPLDAHPTVIYTPHVAGLTVESQERIASVLADDVQAVLAGRRAVNAVGKHDLWTPA
ncbi:D-3-phosphoglycerate dehydrogenase/(S)-sulfolactate dehydrogenase [Prauserella sediminis]|uniref:D-3-phosphoglycerate dehydrogenase/(S)-sulfolactate dehydrogenase n=1 Tax=Prauserella sediminis TaxID=577680 RepID=A0A839XWP2_9PSEU|nr:hydroxyacid dehydrogenase [Prauserella sediminis]MBB3664205.1 D-3-phosphoglycerate dehydrogenase/(S)-sulfolactate dehydrogenase [Prauserella sediminis]